MASLAAVHEVVLVVASDGTLAADVRPLVRINVSVIVEQDGRREQGYAGPAGAIRSRSSSRTGSRCASRAKRCARRWSTSKRCRRPPAPMTVVLGPGWPGRAAARGDRPRPRGRFQSQRDVGVHQPHRRARRLRAVHGRRRRHAAGPPRLAQHRRRGHADALHHADRERRAEGLPAGQAECATHGRRAHRQRAPRVLRARDAAAHDEHLHAARARTTPKRSSVR